MRIRIKGMAELNRKIDRIGRDIRPEIRHTTRAALLYVHSQVPEYPPERPGQTYRRTGGLGRSITTKIREIGSLIVGMIGTAYKNAAWVISRSRIGSVGPQAWMHKDRWWTLQDVVRGSYPTVKGMYEATIRRLLRGG